jgi:putative oxidoreductase
MMKCKWQSWVYWICRLVLGCTFIFAALLKIAAPQAVADSVVAYRLLPDFLVNAFALMLPFFELSSGLLVITGCFIRIGLLGIFTLLILFITALGIALIKGLSIDCGCFVSESWLDIPPWAAFIRDIGLLAITILIYKYYLIKATGSNVGSISKQIPDRDRIGGPARL